MARASCVSHPSNEKYVQVWDNFLTAFGDHCDAAVLHEMIFATDNEISRLKNGGVKEYFAWVTITMQALHDNMLGLYSISKIQQSIKHLVECGMIVIPKEVAVGQVKRYLLNQELANEIARTGKIMVSCTPQLHSPSVILPMGEPSPSVISSVETSVEIPMTNKVLRSEDLKIIKNNTPISPESQNTKTKDNEQTQDPRDSTPEEKTLEPASPAREVDLESDVLDFVKNSYRQARGAKLENLKSKAAYGLCENIRDKERSLSDEIFRGALLNFLDDSNDWLRENHWPIRKFLKDSMRYEPDTARKTARPVAQPARPAISKAPEVVQDPPIRPGAFDAVSIWNEMVSKKTLNCNVAMQRFDRTAAAALEADPDLTEEIYRKVCEQCRSIMEADKTLGSWLHLSWLAKVKDGMPGWVKIHRGTMNWKLDKGPDLTNVEPGKKSVLELHVENEMRKHAEFREMKRKEREGELHAD